MKYIGDGYLLESTGRTFYANCGLLSIGDTAEEEDLYEGYDGYVSVGYGQPFTAEERAEIADFMIAKWQVWKTGGTQ